MALKEIVETCTSCAGMEPEDKARCMECGGSGKVHRKVANMLQNGLALIASGIMDVLSRVWPADSLSDSRLRLAANELQGLVKHLEELGNAGPLLCWLPLEIAPKDGTHIIVLDGVGGVHGAYWCRYAGKESWFTYTNHGWLPSASKWMPFPGSTSTSNPQALRDAERYRRIRSGESPLCVSVTEETGIGMMERVLTLDELDAAVDADMPPQGTPTVPPDVLEKAQALAIACEREQHPNRMTSWTDMPKWKQQHWIQKAQRP